MVAPEQQRHDTTDWVVASPVNFVSLSNSLKRERRPPVAAAAASLHVDEFGILGSLKGPKALPLLESSPKQGEGGGAAEQPAVAPWSQ